MQSTQPKAHLLWMTPDPLGAVAAAVRMYQGNPTYDLVDITDEERRDCWEQSQKTELKAPHEFVKMHFFIEGVPRDLTHQMVRQRTAVYAQESLRFAVKEDLKQAVARPPSLNDPARGQSMRNDLNSAFDRTVDEIAKGYEWLIAQGVPAEDARGLLPGATLTRLNYCTDLRNFAAEAGKRLCTQAQFHWRKLFLSMREAVRTYDPFKTLGVEWQVGPDGLPMYTKNQWQFEMIADSNIFAPVCYHIGKCGFKAEFDRGCTIRDRVDAFEQTGVSSYAWSGDEDQVVTLPNGEMLDAIQKEEWLEDPKAGWVD